MRKFAIIQMGTYYEPEKHHACFSMPDFESHSLTVRNMEEALALVKKLYEEGFRAVELCGAFGEANARKIMETMEGKMVVGYVIGFPEQAELTARYWSGEEI